MYTAMVLLIQCKDRVGLVAAISAVLATRNLNIVSMREHVDVQANVFFTRIVSAQETEVQELQQQLQAVLPADASISINPEPQKKIVLLVTKEYHCLSDILIRHHFSTLGATVQAVIGNHAVLQNICERFDVPFHFISHENKSKETFEQELMQQINAYTFDYIILAKFMRILSPSFVQQFALKIINIHHSFLPAFIGASPYRQAHSRGVKMIGATAHYVTNDLDEGPIIEQQSIPVNHTFGIEDMIKAGKEIEKAVLAKALKLLFEDRVFVYQNKTIVFEY
ncbi:formyltetrahydrofolate deformylase [Lacibacter luteus]|uniref:Formyltetrahydrofolate deformylase n=2 Tax=Lacibacter luteus TaxID=2508719 RepID=A0A4Q1CJ43_9BACT|nr:formyltetrahydrofolate deformylase [Lacibacter luteus]